MSTVINPIVNATAENTVHSTGRIPYRSDRTSALAIIPAKMPKESPVAVTTLVCLKIIFHKSRGLAPTAVRMPNSFFRSLTE